MFNQIHQEKETVETEKSSTSKKDLGANDGVDVRKQQLEDTKQFSKKEAEAKRIEHTLEEESKEDKKNKSKDSDTKSPFKFDDDDDGDDWDALPPFLRRKK